MLSFKHIHHRLVVMILITFVIIQSGILVAVYTATEHNITQAIHQQLVQAETAFESSLNERMQQYAFNANLFIQNKSFIAAIKTDNKEILDEQLAALAKKLRVEVIALVSPNNQVLASTQQKPLPLINMLNLFPKSTEDYYTSSVIAGKHYAYEMVVTYVPVKNQIYYLIIMKQIDNDMLNTIAHLSFSDLEISLFSRNTLGNIKELATTLSPEFQAITATSHTFTFSKDSPHIIKIAGDSFITASSELDTIASSFPVYILFQVNLTKAMQPFNPLLVWLIGLSFIGVSVGVLVSFYIGNSIGKPIMLLSQAVQRVQKGDYSKHIVINRDDELGDLSVTFNRMMKCIASREQHINFQIRHDDITLLPNRRQYFEELSTIVKNHKKGSVTLLHIGIPKFYDVNYTLGYQISDAYIRELAHRIRHHLDTKWIVARLATNTIGVILPDAYGDIDEPIETIKLVLTTPFRVDEISIDYETCIGIAAFPEHASEPKRLMQCADIALYHATKNNAKRPYFYSKEKDPYSAYYLTLMHELQTGIKTGQVQLYFQPQISLLSKTVTGVETLVRWHHPKHGDIYPDDFIPMAEQTGNIEALTFYVLEKAILQARTWLDQNTSLRISVNLSTRDLSNPSLIDYILSKLSEHQVPASLIQIEMTEGSIMAEPDQNLATLNKLQAMGIRLAIDDYGTGYSSMTYLKSLPVNELKIDKSFVLNLADNDEDLILVRSAIELAHNFGMHVVAEGIENQQTMDILSALGCEYGQGYYFGKPMTAERFNEWLSEGKYTAPRNST